MSDWTKFRWNKGRVAAWNEWSDLLETKRIYYSRFTSENGVYELYAFSSDHITPEDVCNLIIESRPTFAPQGKFVGCEILLPHELSAFIDADNYVGNPPDRKAIYY